MKKKIEQILQEVEAFSTDSLEKLEEFRISYLSKKGKIPALFGDFKTVAPEDRKEMGRILNELKTKAQDKLNTLKKEISLKNLDTTDSATDLTRPADFRDLGTRHPLSIVRKEILDIFSRIG